MSARKKLAVAPKNASLRDLSQKWDTLSKKDKNDWVRTIATYAAMIEIMDGGIAQFTNV
ncbi:MAG: hypothetical protein MK132_26015 [Lentisphaerales bacterium]|nr:hypothetical protein [Lentisphaerales bacterium]